MTILKLFRLYLAEGAGLRGVFGQGALFFALVICLGVFAGGAGQETVALVLPGLTFASLWLVAHVAVQDMFEGDARNGRLDAWVLSPLPLPALVAARLLAMFVCGVLPAALGAPVILRAMGALPDVPFGLLYVTLVAAALGTTMLASLSAALLVGGRHGFALTTLLVLPLSAPMILFGGGTWTAAALSLPYQTALGFLLALATAATFAAPFVIAAVLRMKVKS